MTHMTFRKIVRQSLTEIGMDPAIACLPPGRMRDTTWFASDGGLGIRQYASGRQVYVVQPRINGRSRTITIGPASVLTQHQAATVARRVAAHAMVGHDPATTRERIRRAPVMDEFMAEYWKKCSPAWKPSTLITTTDYRRAHIDGAFPEIYVDALTEAPIAKWFVHLTDNAGPGAANRCIDILQAALSKAEAWGYRTENSNPCFAIRRNRKASRTRHLSDAELIRLGEALAKERSSDSQVASAQATAITLLLLTGCRRSEVMSLQWSDLHGSRLRLRDSKTGPRTVWLGPAAVDLLADHPRLPKVPWMFYSLRLKTRLTGVYGTWARIRQAARLKDFRLHDLRHTFASHAAMGRESLPMIGKLLGHRCLKSTARYAHLDDAHLLEATEAIGAAIDSAIAYGR